MTCTIFKVTKTNDEENDMKDLPLIEVTELEVEEIELFEVQQDV